MPLSSLYSTLNSCHLPSVVSVGAFSDAVGTESWIGGGAGAGGVGGSASGVGVGAGAGVGVRRGAGVGSADWLKPARTCAITAAAEYCDL